MTVATSLYDWRLLGNISPGRRAAATHALADAFGSTLWVAVGLIAATLIPALLLPNRHRRQQKPATPTSARELAA